MCGSYESDVTEVTSRIPQGKVPGSPLPFHMNDLPNNISPNLRLFADDRVLYGKGLPSDDHLIFQRNIETINNLCASWLMLLNVIQCIAHCFSRNHSLSHHTWSLGALPISLTSYGCIRVLFAANISSAPRNNVTANASRTVGHPKRHLKQAS